MRGYGIPLPGMPSIADIRAIGRQVHFVPIVLQNSKNGLQRFFREKSSQATIADRCVLKRATEVAGEFIASCYGPPHDYALAEPSARKTRLQ